MLETYRGYGIEFRYPDHWELDEQTDSEQISITVSSPGTSFWSLSLVSDELQPVDLIESALAAFQQEYDELDVYPATAKGPDGIVARDVEFVCLELINSAHLRAFRTDVFTALILYQGTDHELAETRKLLEAITKSLRQITD